MKNKRLRSCHSSRSAPGTHRPHSAYTTKKTKHVTPSVTCDAAKFPLACAAKLTAVLMNARKVTKAWTV